MKNKNIKKVLNDDDICFICDFMEANIDMCGKENKKYCEKLIEKLEGLL